MSLLTQGKLFLTRIANERAEGWDAVDRGRSNLLGETRRISQPAITPPWRYGPSEVVKWVRRGAEAVVATY